MDSKVALLPGARSSFLDHLIPLTELLGGILAITDPHVFELAKMYYPEARVSHAPQPGEMLKNVDLLIYADPSKLPLDFFQCGEYAVKTKGRSLCALHGNSDKYRDAFWAERLADEEMVLLYGPHMVSIMEEKGILHRIPKWIQCGNYRLQHYLQHQEKFDAFIPPFLKETTKRKILYAPTWTSSAPSQWKSDYSSFFEVYPFLFNQLSRDDLLIVKVHPYLNSFFPEEMQSIKETYQEKENIFFLDEFPPIYPLINQVDLFVGDYSSVGYDFLSRDKPLFLFTEKSHPLMKAARVVRKDEFQNLRQILDEEDLFAPERREVYDYAFGNPKTLNELKREIELAYE